DAATFSRDASVCVTLATPDYPRTSTPVSGLPAALDLPAGTLAFWGASKRSGERVDAAGGRVLTIAALGQHHGEARTRAYEAVARIGGQLGGSVQLSFRSDIAKGI
ncbi:MAG: phosphoribosylamine--glycine ligase, partial [Candidatus Eremiobacteraeota bacterium]|nr:phosphoribosylamine--glycine ligase [Candidatus Eremiobacteraeota bacterium]